MAKQVWLNLPVKDLAKAKQFFSSIGFHFLNVDCNAISECMLVGENNFEIMLFDENFLANFNQIKIADTKESCEFMISLGAESRQEVDQYAEKVITAGGNLFYPPAEVQGWMYRCAFADLDSHRWNIVYMHESKMKNNQ